MSESVHTLHICPKGVKFLELPSYIIHHASGMRSTNSIRSCEIGSEPFRLWTWPDGEFRHIVPQDIGFPVPRTQLDFGR